MMLYEITNVTYSYDGTRNENWQTGDCDYIGEHYLITLANVNDPFVSITKRVEKDKYSKKAFYVGRKIEITDHKQNWIYLFNKLDGLTKKPTQYIPHYAAHEIMNMMLEIDRNTIVESEK